MRLMHVGLCVQPKPFNGLQTAFIDVLGEDNYAEISTGDKLLNSEVVFLYERFKPDVIFMQIQAPNIINREVVEYFHDNGTKIINWTGDVRHDVPVWMYDIGKFCISSFSNMNDVKAMRSKGYKAEYLEIGYDPLIYTPEGEAYNVPEIVFMANNYGAGYFPLSKYRSDIVSTLTRTFGNRFGVYGNGWPNAKGNVNSSQPQEAKHYRGAKIAINCSHFNYERYSSDRLLRILGSGTFCLSHHYPNIEIDYIPSVNLDTFSSLEGMVNKINYYLEHEEERKRIASEGQSLVLNRNTFKHYVENMLAL